MESHEKPLLLDNGSDSTCIARNLANDMEFERFPRNIEMSTIQEKDRQVTSDICHVNLQSLQDKEFAANTDAIIIDHIPFDIELIPRNEDPKKFPHLGEMNLHTISPMPQEVEILIGSDMAFVMAPVDGSVRRSTEDSPIGYSTLLGDVIVGPSCYEARAN